MLRIFVTGDNHIGLKYMSHEQCAVLASARIDAFCGMVERANKEECALLVITGDLFENTHSVAKHDVKRLADILSCFNGTVAILPGNHDYYDRETKLYRYFEEVFQNADNVLLLREQRPYRLMLNGCEAVLYPAPCTALHSEPGVNNIGWMRDENIVPDFVFRLGIAHGAVEGESLDREGRYYCMTRDELDAIPVDAWLIGHTHVPFPLLPDSGAYAEAGNIFNAGAHVQTDVSNNTEGVCFIIEIDDGAGRKKVRAKKIVSGNVRFFRKSIEIKGRKLADALKAELSGIPDNSVVELVLSGAVSPEDYEDRNAILDGALERFLESRYSDRQLCKLISKELVQAEFAETSFAAELLLSLLDKPEEAQLVYELLESLKGEGK